MAERTWIRRMISCTPCAWSNLHCSCIDAFYLASTARRVKQVSQAYGLEDGGRAVQGYLNELARGCMMNPSSARGRNLITYAVQLIESNTPLSDSCLSGTLILDRLITRQHTDKIIRAPGLFEQEEEIHQQQLDLGDKTGAPLVKKDTTKKQDNQEESNKKRDERKTKWEERKKKWEEWMELVNLGKRQQQQQHQQTEKEIIVQQRRVIKQLIGSACKGGELQMKAMQILTQLCIDETANRGNLTKVLVSIFIHGDSSNTSIRKTAGETLVALFLSSKSVATLLPKEEHDEFVGDLAKILVQVGDDDTCRKSAAEILERLCILYAENGEYLSTLKNTITGVMPEVLREICYGSAGEEEKSEYARSDTDVESQSNTKKKNTSSSPAQNQQHKLHVALLSLCMMACDKLNLDLDAISMGEGRDQATDLGESVTFSLATKMVQLNRDIITPDSLTAMKLTTKMMITAMKKLRGHGAGVERASLESLMDSLSSVSEIMLDLEGCMVFTTGATTTKPATVDTLNSLVKQARQLHGEIKDHDSEIAPAS